MQKTKLIIALAAVAALTLAAVGLAAAQIAQNQTQTSTQVPEAPDPSLWGWLGNCFRYRTAEPYQEQYIAPPAATTNGTAPQPVPYTPYQGSNGYGYDNGYRYGYGYGRCMGGW